MAPCPSVPFRNWTRSTSAVRLHNSLGHVVLLLLSPLFLPIFTTAAIRKASIIATNGKNSANAPVLSDNSFKLSSSTTWKHSGNPWKDVNYPWNANLDLRRPYKLSKVRIFVAEIPFPSTARLILEASSDRLSYKRISIFKKVRYNRWKTRKVRGTYRYLRMRFQKTNEHFYITEVRVFGTPQDGSPPTPTTSPAVTSAPSPTTECPYCPSCNLQCDTPPANLQSASFSFTDWPNAHLSAKCIKRHNRYWTLGPHADASRLPASFPRNDVEYRAYHTWHPAIETLPDGTVCDYGHEHGNNPQLAGSDMFALFGGWPPFGYVAAKAGGQRMEDHVGHKVSVARFRAAIGDGANKGSVISDAGFTCRWLSKLHQGSWSTDALKNAQHEYFLALSCDDGPGGGVGTRLSVKFMYVFGEANKFAPLANGATPVLCGPNPQTASAARGFNGAPIGLTALVTPMPNAQVNHREFMCYDELGWRTPEDQPQVDLWTQPTYVNRDGMNVIFLQPYYIVKNPARMVKDGRNVRRTLDLCRSDHKGNFCDAATSFSGGWDDGGTPFNGALRAINFKMVILSNDGGGGATRWCTDAFGRGGFKRPPCKGGDVEQRATAYRNRWEGFSRGGVTGEVKGAVWVEDACGRRREAEVVGGERRAFGMGFELVVDNREPDDDCDGVVDGASLRGRN